MIFFGILVAALPPIFTPFLSFGVEIGESPED